jgi:aryl carrier-like protein
MEQSTFATAGSSNRTATNNEIVEKDIREICAEVLRRPVGKIKLDKSFIAQGGDSLLAIKLMARCGEAGYTITINDMLQATSIRDLCQSVKLAEGSSAPGKHSSGPVLDGPAQPAEIRTTPLTEAQKFYASTKAWDVKVFQLEGGIAESTLYAALKLLVSHHPILRANFTTLENNDLRLTYNDTTEAFAHRRFEIPTISAQAEQEYLTVGWEADRKREDGLFAATIFVQQDRDHGTCLARYLRLDLHRAIVDVSSWDILQRDLDHALLGKPLARGNPETSFDSWAWTRNQGHSKFESSTPVESTNGELNTNGKERQNGHQNDGKIDLADVAILETVAAGLAKLEDEGIHSVLRTQTEDFIIAALYIALKGVTRSEETLSFGIISNSRHSGGPELSATVGCFDNIIRRSVEREEEDGGLGFLRKVKDTRMGFFNGSRISGVEDRSRYVLLHMGQLESTAALRADTLHEVFHRDDFSTLPNGCLAFVEPFSEQQQLKLRLRSRSSELGREKLGQIAGLFRAALKELIAECEMSEVQGTLSDFPFLQLTYSELDNLVSSRLKAITGDPFRDVEAVFPCGPRQEAFLVAQAVYPDLYHCSFVIKMSSEDPNVELDCGRLRDAWVRLVARHPALRTAFIESPNRQGHFDQVVMKQGISSITFLEDEGEEAARQLACRRPVTYKSRDQTHQVTFCRVSPSSVYLRLDMSHAVVDGLSAQVLIRDLFQIYSKQKLASRVMAYQDFVNYQARLPMQESVTYWSNYLAGAQPSHFPLYGDQLSREDLRTVRLNIQLGSDILGEFCGKFNITPANICQVAWALVLRSYTGLEDVCFSYATSGRDVPLKGINNTVGAFLNAVVCRIKLPPTATVPQALIKARDDFVESLSHQYYSAFDDAQSGEFARFKSNTLMSCQRKAATELAGSGLAFELVDAANPNEVSSEHIPYIPFDANKCASMTCLSTFKSGLRAWR